MGTGTEVSSRHFAQKDLSHCILGFRRGEKLLRNSPARVCFESGVEVALRYVSSRTRFAAALGCCRRELQPVVADALEANRQQTRFRKTIVALYKPVTGRLNSWPYLSSGRWAVVNNAQLTPAKSTGTTVNNEGCTILDGVVGLELGELRACHRPLHHHPHPPRLQPGHPRQDPFFHSPAYSPDYGLEQFSKTSSALYYYDSLHLNSPCSTAGTVLSEAPSPSGDQGVDCCTAHLWGGVVTVLTIPPSPSAEPKQSCCRAS